MVAQQEKVLNAKWEFDSASGYTKHTLSYDPNGGTGSVEPQYFVAGEKLVTRGFVLENLSGAAQLGWNTQADAKGKAYDCADVIALGDADVTLYAQWNEAYSLGLFMYDMEYKVYYHVNYGTQDDAMSFDYGYTERVASVKEWSFLGREKPADKAFAGWSLNKDGTGTRFYPGDKVTLRYAGVHLYAVWADTYTVTFADGFGGAASVSVASGERVSKPSDPSRMGYTFAGWYNGDTPFDFSTPITGSMVLTARWQAINLPQTGDSAHPALWILALTVSLCGLALLRKRRTA